MHEKVKNILCIAGGSGIAGMMAIMERGCEESYFSDHKGYVFFGARTANDMFFVDELSSFVNAYPQNLEVTIALSDEGISKELEALHPKIKFDTGFVHTATSEKMAGKFENMMAYVAGPPPMVDGALRRQGAFVCRTAALPEKNPPPKRMRYFSAPCRVSLGIPNS